MLFGDAEIILFFDNYQYFASVFLAIVTDFSFNIIGVLYALKKIHFFNIIIAFIAICTYDFLIFCFIKKIKNKEFFKNFLRKKQMQKTNFIFETALNNFKDVPLLTLIALKFAPLTRINIILYQIYCNPQTRKFIINIVFANFILVFTYFFLGYLVGLGLFEESIIQNIISIFIYISIVFVIAKIFSKRIYKGVIHFLRFLENKFKK